MKHMGCLYKQRFISANLAKTMKRKLIRYNKAAGRDNSIDRP